MQPPKLTYDKSELVIRKEAWINLILGFPAIILFAAALFFHKETRPFFRENPLVTASAILLFLTALYFLVRNSLDRRIKMVINKNGIWTPQKGLMLWGNIQHYYFEEVKGEGADTSLLRIGLVDIIEEVKINISFFTVSEQAIEAAIERNRGDYDIIAPRENN